MFPKLPVYSTRQAFSKPYLRHKPIARVLSQIPNWHIVIDESEELPQPTNFLQ
ncbi:hypothetical protein IQ235_18350 [Oscillatoriales cyanobacterium LEGE 11467]|uniref:Uncharacterized protein n=1 Tax=Zarconia navalis LEGE 11467 TaxID=1828826 RepID=A0A928W3S7_9CYAN|nr:hypothetical protein [Zarconia navalis]MBE9042725.1 hypothetical protein [Zarconia navalis LEGE 11467]